MDRMNELYEQYEAIVEEMNDILATTIDDVKSVVAADILDKNKAYISRLKNGKQKALPEKALEMYIKLKLHQKKD